MGISGYGSLRPGMPIRCFSVVLEPAPTPDRETTTDPRNPAVSASWHHVLLMLDGRGWLAGGRIPRRDARGGIPAARWLPGYSCGGGGVMTGLLTMTVSGFVVTPGVPMVSFFVPTSTSTVGTVTSVFPSAVRLHAAVERARIAMAAMASVRTGFSLRSAGPYKGNL